MSKKTLKDAMEAARACAARPEEKKRLGPMFGWALELLAAEVARLRTYESEYCIIAKDYDDKKDEVRKLKDLLHYARVRIRFMNGRVLSLEQAIRSNAKLSGAAYIRASK